MAQVLIRNLDDDVVARLKARAAAANTSLEQYLRDLIARDARPSKEEWLTKMAAFRAQIPPLPADAPRPEEVVRAAREERDAAILGASRQPPRKR